jgi:hypothetical protein
MDSCCSSTDGARGMQVNGSPSSDREQDLRAFIREVIVPVLLERFLAEHRRATDPSPVAASPVGRVHLTNDQQ